MANSVPTQWGPWTINDAAYRLVGAHKYERWHQAMARESRVIQDETDPHKRYKALKSHSERVIEIEFLGLLIAEKYIVTSIRDGVVAPVPLSQIPLPSVHISLFDDLIAAESNGSIVEWPFVAVRPPATEMASSRESDRADGAVLPMPVEALRPTCSARSKKPPVRDAMVEWLKGCKRRRENPSVKRPESLVAPEQKCLGS